jgi:hypothetical protein
MKRWFIIMLLLIGTISCEETIDATFTPQIVLEGYLYANEPIDSIVIRRTLDIGESASRSYLPGANVTLGVGDQEYQLVERAGLPGRYFTPTTLFAAPGRTYTLRVEALGQVATSETTVPQPIYLDSARIGDRVLSIDNVDTIDYPKDITELARPGIRLWWSKGELSHGYALEAVSFDTLAQTIDIDIGRELPDSLSMGRYRYFILSESEQILWLQFKRYGLNTVRVLSLDRNMQDFALGVYLTRSQFDNATLRVTGGLGLFGSAARASKQVYLRKVE